MAIMLLASPFNSWLLPPYSYIVVASLSLVLGIVIMFFWRKSELNTLRIEVNRLTQLCYDWERIVQKQERELQREKSVREGLEDAFSNQKQYTDELLEKVNFMYAAMLSNGTLSKSDLKWLAEKDMENIMKLFDKK